MKPVELYRFTQGASVFTYTSADKAQTHNAEEYEPIPIGRSGIELRNELSKANIDVRMPLGHEQAQEWMRATSEAPVGLTLFRKMDATTEVIWKGRMAGVKPQLADVVFAFESIFTSLRRPGLRRRYQRPCPHVLYRRGCWLDKADFAVAGTLTAVNGSVVTVTEAAAAPAGDYLTGMLESPDGTFRFITAHSGSSLTLSRPIKHLQDNIAGGPISVTLYPGCDRSHARCLARFNNTNNYGGQRFIPIRNPFDSTSIL